MASEVEERRVPSGLDPAPSRVARLAARRSSPWSLPEVRWAAASLLLFLLGVLLRYGTPAPAWAGDAVFLACYAAGGWEPLRAGLQALRERTLDVDLLMSVAALGAAAIGQVLDGGLLIVIFATSGAQEAYATQRTRDSVRALLDLAPERATVLADDGGEHDVDTVDLVVGQTILVRPGERIGADGTVVSGTSEVDQASITGEPLPLLRAVGDEVFAGTLNRDGALKIRVERPTAESVVARIVALVEQASATKATMQLFVEKIEQRYSVGVVLSTLAVFLVPLGLGESLRPALLRAMTYMIVASPCAVVLATMPPLLSAIANAGRHGVLVKSAVVMEQLGCISQVAFDKTGTLTQGTPRVTDVLVLPGTGITEDELLTLAAAAERPSEHPLARAVVQAALDRGLPVPTATDFTSTPGQGVSCRVDGRAVRVGRAAQLRTVTNEALTASVDQLQAHGHTASIVVIDDKPLGLLAFADQLRVGAEDAVTSLTATNGRPPVLLTGDHQSAADLLARQVGITDVRAGLLPAEKVAQVADLRRSGHRVLVVGDGVIEAPALAAADLGVAMGGNGSDLALQTADAVLVRDDLATLAPVISLSRQARAAVRQNLALAGTAIVGLIAWDLLGHLPLPLGVAGHEGGTVLVGLNGLRLLRASAWHQAAPAKDHDDRPSSVSGTART